MSSISETGYDMLRRSFTYFKLLWIRSFLYNMLCEKICNLSTANAQYAIYPHHKNLKLQHSTSSCLVSSRC